MNRDEEQMLLTVEQVAEYLQLNPETIRRYIRKGKLKARRTPGKRGHYRIHRDEVDLLRPPQQD